MRNAALFLLAGLAASAVSEPTRRRTAPGKAAAIFRRQGVPDDCTFFDTATSADNDCEYFASVWGITAKDFIAWNPSVGADCSGIKVGQEYCVERNWGIPPTETITSSVPGPTNTVPSPVQEGIIGSCTSYHKAVSGDDCSKIVAQYGTFAFADFLKWNPAVGETCAGLWLGYYYCVAVPGTPTGATSAAPVPTATSTVPSPAQDGITKECKAYYKAVAGDDCSKIVAKYGTFTFADFLKWNPAVGSTCSGLWLGYNYCVGVSGTPTEPPRPTTTACTGPDPTQPGAVCPCQRWHKVVSGNTCDSIQRQYGITTAQFNKWNPQVGTTCSTLWLGYNVCVSAA
ncbi:hypothetical protein LX36DRAFT_583537 [Colletotrichum falcatum]|nr:hypothetical protein LX36DRAFT_583537 [Colletotrichum falcatum]